MASAKCCQRRERRLLNDIRHVASGLVHRIRHRLQAASAAAEDQFLPVNHAAAVGVSNSALCAEGRAISRAPFTFRMAAMSLGIYYWGARSCLPQANFSGDEEE